MAGVLAVFVSLALALSSNVGARSDTVSDTLSYGNRGAEVAELNKQLRVAGFNPDGGSVFGAKTRHAVYAFQKLHDLPTTGRFTPFMWRILAQLFELVWRSDTDRVEVDLDRQVLYVVKDHEVALIVPIS